MKNMTLDDKRPDADSGEPEEESITSYSQTEFAELFFEAIDEDIERRYQHTGGRHPDWEEAVARAKLEGVVPLNGSGPRVMATLPNRGVTITGCYGDCLFRLQACNCNSIDNDVCTHPGAPSTLELTDDVEPPKDCPLREATFFVVLAREFCVDKNE